MSENERQLADSRRAPPTVPLLGSSEPGASGPSGNDSQASLQAKRRRRPADAKSQPRKNQPFYFVDSTSSSKEKRAHVMRHHVQEKKKQRKLSHDPSFSKPGVNHTQPVGTGSGNDAEREAEAPLNSAQESSANKDSSLQIRFSAVRPYSQATVPVRIGSPITMMDASRKDPFASLPFMYDREDLELVDYWTNKLTYWSGPNTYLKNQIFRTAMGHPLSFQAVVLSYCARWKGQLYGITDSTEIRRHVDRSRRLIDDASAGSMSVNEDDLAMALAGMALQEERFGSKPVAQTYATRAVQIMRPRTGSNMPVEAFLQYVRYIMTPVTATIKPADRRWLVTFLRGAEDLMGEHNSPEYSLHAPRRRDAFQMESPLFSLLSSGPRPSQVPQASRMYVVRDSTTQEVSRTAALIYITAALWDFQDSPNKTNRFLLHLDTIVQQHHLDRHPACETLLWVLLEEGYEADLQNPERGWSTGELLKTHKQLRPDLQFQFNEILMNFLSLRAPIRGINVFEEELQTDCAQSMAANTITASNP